MTISHSRRIFRLEDEFWIRTDTGKLSLRWSRNLERPANAAHRIVVYFSVAGNSGSLSISRIPPHGMLPAFAIKLAAVR